MPVESAGLLMCRKLDTNLEFFLIHPGGPFWARKNEGAWSIPKGLAEPHESKLETAMREFYEETGIKPQPPYTSLGISKMTSGKILYAWTFSGMWDPLDGIKSNYIDIEYPPRSKKFISIPEADRAEWMTYDKAIIMITSSQKIFVERAAELH